MCVIHCRNGCTDMLYYCVIFVILNKKIKKSLKKEEKKRSAASPHLMPYGGRTEGPDLPWRLPWHRCPPRQRWFSAGRGGARTNVGTVQVWQFWGRVARHPPRPATGPQPCVGPGPPSPPSSAQSCGCPRL